MTDNGLGFQLVLWLPMPEKLIGRCIAGHQRDDVIEWIFGRRRGVAF
jgi:hypothetical protein